MKKGISAISGVTSPTVGEKYTYHISEWYPNTPISEREQAKVTWELFKKRSDGRFTTTHIKKKGDSSFTFGESSAGETYRLEGYLYQPEGGGLIITPKASKIPKICKVDLNYVDDSKGSVFSFTEKLRAKAHCINMFNKEVLFTLWEDDAKGSGHNTTNQLIDTKKAKVDLYGDAEVDFMLTKALMKKAMEGETDIRELEFYVTVEYYKTKKHTTSNVEVKNPSPTENKKPSQPTAIKKAKGSPAEHKPRSKKEEKGVFGSISETIDEIWDWAETQGIAQRDKPHTIEIPEGKSPAVIGKMKVEKKEEKKAVGKCPNCDKDITVAELRQIFSQADQITLTKVAATYNKYMKELGMNTCWNKAHFFAQARIESGPSLHVSGGENFNYYWKALITTFGVFQTAEGKEKAKLWGRAIKDRTDPKCVDVSQENQRKIANYAYSPPAEKAKDLENTQPNDGWNFRGKGLLQLTGRNAYTYANTYTKKEGADIIANPDLVISDVSIAVLSSMAFWKWKKIDQLTKGNNSTKKICVKVGKDIDGNHSKKQKVFIESTSKVFKTNQCKLTNESTANKQNKKAPWMPYAIGEIGQKAILGDTNNPRISEYFDASMNGKGNNESTNWCGAFASWCFSQAGYTPPALSCRAAMWQFWKQDRPIYGSAAVIDWDSNQLAKQGGKDGAVGGDGHITFVVGKSADGKYYYCVGGNQGGTKGARTVKISKYSKNDIDWFVIPPNYNPTDEEYDLKIMTSESDVDSANNTRS
ncbi:hypothetical protein JJC04_05185 [Flavobacterium covae]|nr:hypothetical protein [Flavobacterium covae]QYS92015.1 hypothetical protein JJC04_05185 [Flavobacterium covae]